MTVYYLLFLISGIWMKNRMHAEMPDVHFIYKYLLLAEIDSFEEPIVCSTFTTYKENDIKDHCTIIKVVLHYLDMLRNTKFDFSPIIYVNILFDY